MAATTKSTKRPLNKCKDCGKTWYPRGSNVSSRCPRCGSTKTKVAGLGILGTIGALVLMATFSGHPNSSTNQNAVINTGPTPPVVVTKPVTEAYSRDVSANNTPASVSSAPVAPQSSAAGIAAPDQAQDSSMDDASAATQVGSRKDTQKELQSTQPQESSDVFKHH